jgi:hypothetical protein
VRQLALDRINNTVMTPEQRALALQNIEKSAGQVFMGNFQGDAAAAEYERQRVIRNRLEEEAALSRQETMNRRAALERLGQTYK